MLLGKRVPLQSLLLWNAPQYVEAARQMAARVELEGGVSVRSRCEYAFRLATARRPTDAEVKVLSDVFAAELEWFKTDKD